MKKFIKIIAAVLILLIIAAIAIPFLVPLDAYKGQIISTVKDRTGLDLTIDGSMKASIFPVVGVKLGKVTLSNPKGYSAKNIIEADALNIEVALIPLLKKQIQIQQFILDKPLVNLEVNNTGKPNWEFGTALNSEAAEKPQGTAEKVDGKDTLLAGLMLGDIKVTNGEINYLIAKTKKNINVKSLNVKASLLSISKPFSLDGDAVWNGEKVTIKAKIAQPDQIIEGKKSAFDIEIKSSPANVHYQGEATQTSALGNLDLNVPSIPNLQKWVSGTESKSNDGPQSFALKAIVDASQSVVSLKNAEITLGDAKLSGDIKAKIDGQVPDLTINLSCDSLNLNSFIAPAPAKTSAIFSAAYAAELSNKPIDLSALKSANAKVKLSLGNITYQKIKLGKTVINADLNNGQLKLNIPEMDLYGGSAKINGTLDSSGTFSKQLNIAQVNLGQLLEDAMDKSRFTGTINGAFNLNGRMNSVQGAMNSLGGNGDIKVTNGTIKGIDLRNLISNLKSAVTKTENPAEQTAFSELSGTFTIASGIIANNDLILKSDVLTLGGKGTVNLPMQTINYRLSPEFASTVKRGDGSETKGLEVPILVQGPLDSPRFIPDLAGIVKSTLENPNALRNTVKTLKEQFKEGKGANVDNVKDLLKGFGQ